MAALLKKTIQKGSGAFSGHKNVIKYQEFTHDEEDEEETKEHSYPINGERQSETWQSQVRNEGLYDEEEEYEGTSRVEEVGYLFKQY